jgi:hypothetical protein
MPQKNIVILFPFVFPTLNRWLYVDLPFVVAVDQKSGCELSIEI